MVLEKKLRLCFEKALFLVSNRDGLEVPEAVASAGPALAQGCVQWPAWMWDLQH